MITVLKKDINVLKQVRTMTAGSQVGPRADCLADCLLWAVEAWITTLPKLIYSMQPLKLCFFLLFISRQWKQTKSTSWLWLSFSLYLMHYFQLVHSSFSSFLFFFYFWLHKYCEPLQKYPWFSIFCRYLGGPDAANYIQYDMFKFIRGFKSYKFIAFCFIWSYWFKQCGSQ